MKRLFTLLLACLLLCALAVPALADVAYMPRDRFLEKHWEDCRYENRWYYANGPEGYVLAHKTPDSATATPLPNGGKYYISNVYRGEWGVLEYDKETLTNNLGNGSVSGWVRMSEMVPDYDNDAFESDHWSEFIMDSAELELAEDSTAYGYKYPGSGIVVDEFSGQYYREPLQLSPLFTDPAGRTWGFMGYYYGRHNCWICIDDPANDALAPDENCVTVVTEAPSTPTQAPTPTDVPTPTAAPTEEPVPEPISEPDPTPSEAPAPTAEPTPSEAPAETPDKPTVPSETPAPSPAGKTVELTPPADKDTLDQAAKDNRGAGPYIAAGAAAVVIVAAAVLVSTLKKKK